MLLTAKQLAQHAEVSTKTIMRMKDRGEIPYYQIGRQIRFKLCEVEEATRCQKSKNEAP